MCIRPSHSHESSNRNHSLACKSETMCSSKTSRRIETKGTRLGGPVSIVLVVLFALQAPLFIYYHSSFFCSYEDTNKNIPSATTQNDEHPLAWTNPFTGMQFYKYKEDIDAKILAYRKSIPHLKSFEMPLYKGEYGYELAGIVPWAYYRSKKYELKTKGRPGTKYLYYFSKEHEIVSSGNGQPQRSSHGLPKDSPFGETPHFDDAKFPQERWTPPPYKQFFKRDDVKLDKPLLIISNKYTMEWSGGPINHIPIETLWEILKFLSPRYHIVYNRFKDKRLEDKLESKIDTNAIQGVQPYQDKEMIKRFFPSVVLFEELSQNLESDDVNLLMFSLSAMADKFVSVQGGNSVVASFFGGANIIHCVRGSEVDYHSEHGGDFSYYHRFSNATIQVASGASELCTAVKENTIDDLSTVTEFCTGTKKIAKQL